MAMTLPIGIWNVKWEASPFATALGVTIRGTAKPSVVNGFVTDTTGDGGKTWTDVGDPPLVLEAA